MSEGEWKEGEGPGPQILWPRTGPDIASVASRRHRLYGVIIIIITVAVDCSTEHITMSGWQ